jgi:DcuC family C4-dicarboxylate transporter
MLPAVGLAIVLATVYAIVKRMETRLVLLASGFLMCLVALKPNAAFTQFATSMTNAGLITAILSVMGFAYVMKLTECDQHLVRLVAGAVTKFRFALIPLSIIITFFIGIALPSASGVAAAVGAVLIPVMISAGVHPATAAAAIVAGSYGSTLSPGSAHTVMVSKMAKVAEMDVIRTATLPTLATVVVAIVALSLYTRFTKQDRGYLPEEAWEQTDSSFQVNYLKAIVPLLPLVLLVLGSRPQFKSWNITVSTAMLVGVAVALLVSRAKPAEVTKAFFEGMGKAYGDIMGIIIAAGVFTAGLKAVGLIDLMINNLKSFHAAVGAAGTWGPMLIAVLSGSGDAATIAFNEAVTPHAAQFGLSIQKLGMLASLTGSLGRTMSPVAGVVIVAAGIARVSPLEVAKRNALGMILASVVALLMLGL